MDNAELLQIYRQMLLIRRFEDRAEAAYRQDKIGGYLHVYIGQEAVACGLISAKQPGDLVVDSYRDHGHYIMCGGDAKAGMAELYGKDTGCSRGKGGSMHLYDAANGFYGGTGIVGAGIGLGAGLGFALKYRKTDNIALCFFGDGAVNTGLFHESLNLAELWDLPVIFIIENNLYAMGTSVERSSAVTNLASRGSAYGIEHEQVDGMNLFKVRECADRVIPWVREHKRPYLIEAITYRYRGHGAADPANYRTRAEVDEWRERDPIGVVEKHLLDAKAITEEDVKRIAEEVEAEVKEILRFAEESPVPPPDALTDFVYAT